jgi:hypothetical protein
MKASAELFDATMIGAIIGDIADSTYDLSATKIVVSLCFQPAQIHLSKADMRRPARSHNQTTSELKIPLGTPWRLKRHTLIEAPALVTD